MIVFPRPTAPARCPGENIVFANTCCGGEWPYVSRVLLTFPQSTPPTTTTIVFIH